MRKAQLHKYLRAAMLSVGLLVTVAGVPVAKAADDTNSKIIEYYRRKANLPPQVDVMLINIKDSDIKGLKSGQLQLSQGAQKQTVDILMSPDGKWVVFAAAEDVSKDPFKAIAEKITTKGAPTKGPKDAKVTIVEFSDFQCPYCARAHSTLTNEVLNQYGDKVKVVYKNFPLSFHPWAEPAAVAAACIYEQNPDAFWKIYNYYFDNQKDLNPQNVKEKTLEVMKDSKIDTAKFNDCFDNKKTLERIKADMAEGQVIGVTGTPAFVINGRKLSGAQPADRFKAIIDDELQRPADKS